MKIKSLYHTLRKAAIKARDRLYLRARSRIPISCQGSGAFPWRFTDQTELSCFLIIQDWQNAPNSFSAVYSLEWLSGLSYLPTPIQYHGQNPGQDNHVHPSPQS